MVYRWIKLYPSSERSMESISMLRYGKLLWWCTKYKNVHKLSKDTVLITKFFTIFCWIQKTSFIIAFFSNSDHFATLTLILDSGFNETKFERVDRVGNCDRVIMEYTINNYVIYRPMYKLYTPPSEFWIPLHGNKELADVFRLILLSEHITVREGGQKKFASISTKHPISRIRVGFN